MMLDRPIRLGIIGCGGIAGSHLRALKTLPEFEVAAVCDVNVKRASEFMAEAGGSGDAVFCDWRDMIRSGGIDAVDIATPPVFHHGPAVFAAEHGLHVFVEKPMAPTLAECDAMIEAADLNGVYTMVGQVLRFRDINQRAKQLIEEGRIGEVRNVIRRRWGFTKDFSSEPWANDPSVAAGWVLYGFGPHAADLILWLTRTSPVRVFAMGQKINPFWRDYDDITIQIELSNGGMATQSHSVNSRASAWDIALMGTKDAMYINGDSIVVGEETIEVPLQEFGGMKEQFAEFGAAILEDREPEASGKDVRRTMVLLEAAKISMCEGCVVDAANL